MPLRSRKQKRLFIAGITLAITLIFYLAFIYYTRRSYEDYHHSYAIPAPTLTTNEGLGVENGNSTEFHNLSDASATTGQQRSSYSSLSPEGVIAQLNDAGTGHSREALLSYLNVYGVEYEMAIQLLSEEDVPVLIDMLSDEKYQDNWRNIVFLISFLGKGEEASHALVDFIARKDDWKAAGQGREYDVVYSKVTAVSHIGLIRDDYGASIIRELLNAESIERLTSEWIGGELPAPWDSNPSELTVLFQGSAAMAIACSQNTSDVILVEDLYINAKAKHQETLRRHGVENVSQLNIRLLSPEENNAYLLYSQLVDALAMRDLIDEIGFENFLSLIGKPYALSSAISTYLNKY